MKLHASLLLLAFLSCAILSCSHKDDNAKPSTQIIGKWKGDKIIEILSQGDQQVESDTITITSPDSLILEFKSDLTFSIASSTQGSDFKESGTYSISGNNLLLGGQTDPTDNESFVVTVKGNSMELVETTTETNNNIDYKEEQHLFLTKM